MIENENILNISSKEITHKLDTNTTIKDQRHFQLSKKKRINFIFYFYFINPFY